MKRRRGFFGGVMVASLMASLVAVSAWGAVPVELLRNGDFEGQLTLSPWVVETTKGGAVVKGLADDNNGAANHCAVLGGTNSETDSLEQTIIIPAGATQTSLDFTLRIQTTGNDPAPHDFLRVLLVAHGASIPLTQYSNADASDWKRITITGLDEFSGELVTIKFIASTDGTRPTQFWLDNVSLSTTAEVSAEDASQLSFVSPNYSCSYPAPLGPAVTGSGPLALIADAPHGVRKLSAAINNQLIVSTDQNYLNVPIPWSSLPPGQSTLTGTLIDASGATSITSCTINNTNLLKGGDFEADGEWAWDQDSKSSGSYIRDVGADSAHSGARVAVLATNGQHAESLDQVVEFPPNLQDPLVLSFFYETSAAQTGGMSQPLSVHFIDLESGQDMVAATMYPSAGGWIQVKVPISMAQLGLAPGREYRLRFQAGRGQAGHVALAATGLTTYAVDDASLMMLPIDPGGGGTLPDDEVPDSDEATLVAGAPNPRPTLVDPHYGRKEGGDRVRILGAGFDPANIKVKFRRGLTCGNWATATECGPQGCLGHSNSDDIANIDAVQQDGSVISMGPDPACPVCGTPKSCHGYGHVRVIVKNLTTKNKHGLSFKDSSRDIVGFAYGWPTPQIDSIEPVSASIKGGDPITIHGANFAYNADKPTTVTIGQIALTLTEDSFQDQAPDGTFQTIVGEAGSDGWWVKECPGTTKPGTTTNKVNVKVTNPDGNYARLKDSFTYIAEQPAITGFSPGLGPSKGGTLVTIHGTNLRRIGSVLFGSKAADCSTISGIEDGITVLAPPGCGNQPITVQTVDSQHTTSMATFVYQDGPLTFNIGSATGTQWTCVSASTHSVTVRFIRGAASPCGDITTANIILTKAGGAPQNTLVLNSSGIAIANHVSAYPGEAELTIPLEVISTDSGGSGCPPGGITENFTMTVTAVAADGHSASGTVGLALQGSY